MARSLLRQLEQIRRSNTYDDAIANVNTSTVAEPTTISGYLEEDLNNLRTLILQMKSTVSGSNWYDAMGTYFDPTSTTSGNANTKDLNFANIQGHTTDAKTVIIAVEDDSSGSGYTVSGTSTGILMPLTTVYATPTDRRGLPIFASTANTGSYWDEGGLDRVCRIDVLDMATDAEFQTNAGDVVYAKFHDGADFSGTGTGTDVYARFYAGGSPVDLSTISGGAPSSVYFVYPQRKVMNDVEEWEWLRTDFVSSWEGDVELVEDIQNLWSFTGSGDNISSPTWTNTTSNYPLSTNPGDLETGIDLINTSIGDRTYTEDNYIDDGESISDSLDKLDQALKDVADDVTAGVGEKYVESVASEITANTVHGLPFSITYTPHSAAGREGKNMDVYVDGQLLAADTGSNGANADRDYGETTTSGVTFRFTLQAGRNITYVVRQ